MSDIASLWWLWIVLAAVLLVALIVWALVARRKRLEAARAEATSLRTRAKQGEGVAATSEEHAAQLQAEAREAQRKADELYAQAEKATQQARDQRDRVTDHFVDADEVDPDAKKKRS